MTRPRRELRTPAAASKIAPMIPPNGSGKPGIPGSGVGGPSPGISGSVGSPPNPGNDPPPPPSLRKIGRYGVRGEPGAPGPGGAGSGGKIGGSPPPPPNGKSGPGMRYLRRRFALNRAMKSFAAREPFTSRARRELRRTFPVLGRRLRLRIALTRRLRRLRVPTAMPSCRKFGGARNKLIVAIVCPPPWTAGTDGFLPVPPPNMPPERPRSLNGIGRVGISCPRLCRVRQVVH
jgi:hypothetical protein